MRSTYFCQRIALIMVGFCYESSGIGRFKVTQNNHHFLANQDFSGYIVDSRVKFKFIEGYIW